MAWGLAGCGQVPSLLWTCETWPGGAGHPPWTVPGAAAWERSGPRPREGSGNLGARRSGREQAPAGPGAQTAKARGGHRPTAVPQSQRSSCPRPLPPGRVRPAWPSAGGERSRSVSAPAAPAPRRRRWESAGRSPQAPPQLTAASAAASSRPGPAVLRPRVPASPVAHPAPSSPMEPLLRAELRTTTLRAFGSPGAGCISEGRAYDTDAGPVFVKVNRRSLARQMFEGEMTSLEALRSTGLVRAPRPIKVIDLPGGGAAFVMEHLKMRGLSSQAAKLGDQMAELHLYNQKLGEKLRGEESRVGQRAEGAGPQYVTKFGFHTVTCCGFIPQVNEWQDDWPTFFARHRLQAQLDLIEKDYADREARELWSRLQVKIPDLFCGLEIVPALLHGDLWSGNVAEDDLGPVVYDPASFYGHSEFELAIALMFGGFPRPFFTAYHRKVPKAPGFDRRLLLYQLFNYLNHWNHFGRQYRSPSLGTMRKLLK
uniref:protein-ribulosamine 3-kinase n=1 Tax=Sus scrofa TaxID=9823 RepID=F1S006_PIG